MDLQAFLNGGCFDAHSFFGAHPSPEHGWTFRLYAPHAKQVMLEGDFNHWQEAAPVHHANGVWEFHDRNAAEGQHYKYVVYSQRGTRLEKADPYAFSSECPPRNASTLFDQRSIRFHDDSWCMQRTPGYDRPVLIYELHIPTWQHSHDCPHLSWSLLAEQLIPWLKRFHYTHVELLPINEYPNEGSWGYQCTGFFSPTARYGTPADFAAFVDALHRESLGVIIDFVCAHFASDRYALSMLDGTALYESTHPSERRSDWGSTCFDHSKGPVRSFLQSAAMQWLSVYHVDGLRFDAVSHLLYRGGKTERGENIAGIRFLQSITAGLKACFPEVMLIAEDSTQYAGTTAPLSEWGGLGFDYKWDMGWTYDTLQYLQLSPSARVGRGDLLTLGLAHKQQARWMLCFSHDDASWKHLVERMPGSTESKLRQTKLFLMLMAAHPGKKLLFMGTDLGMGGSWKTGCKLDLRLDDQLPYLGYGFFCEDLWKLLSANSALYAADSKSWTADWICCDPDGSCVFAMVRHSADHHVLTLLNFSSVRQSVSLSVPHLAAAQLLLHTDWVEYEGHTSFKDTPFRIADQQLSFTLPRYAGMMLEICYQ